MNVDLTSPEPKVEKRSLRPRLQLTDLDPKQFGYQFKNDFGCDCVQEKRRNLWYLNNGYSRHMTGDSTMLTEFVERADPSITFGDDSKCYTMGYSLILKENVIIEAVALVEGLKHNLLSISQCVTKEMKSGSLRKPVLSLTKQQETFFSQETGKVMYM